MTESEQYIENAIKNYAAAINIMKAKCGDYAQTFDPFANFKACEVLQIEYKRGILVRCLDKLVRVNNLLQRDAQVKDESIEDTLLDICNYFNIVLMAVQKERSKNVD